MVFRGMFPLRKSSTGAAFYSTTAARGEEGEEKHVLGFLSFLFLRRNSPV